MKNKLIIFGIFLALIFTLIYFASAIPNVQQKMGVYSNARSALSVNYQVRPNYQTYYAGRIGDYWPAVTEGEQCKARQDFILQTGIAGCEPMVVRSDLLAEQNVPVFCQIDAMQVNPLLNVKAIKNIRFTGKYPAEVAGTGFHPARAALRTEDTLLGSPLINNIGYVVIILKRNPVEKNLSDYVVVNLTGEIEYEAGNALGIGRTEFLLEEVSDAEWESEKAKYGFWNGKYFLRLEKSDAKTAYLGVYYGDARIGSITAELGKTAPTFYLPGYYCQAGLDASYSGLVIGGPNRARIEVSSDSGTNSYVVTEGSSFDNDRCRVNKIESKSSSGEGIVYLSCRGADKIVLSLKSGEIKVYAPDKSVIYPKIFEKTINDNKKTFAYIELRKDYGDIKKGIYYVSDEIDKNNKLFYSASLGNIGKDDDGGDKDWHKETQKALSEILEKYKKPSESGILIDKTLSGEKEDAFNEAIAAYERVADEYPYERKLNVDGADIYGEIALRNALELASYGEARDLKKATQERILRKLIEKYPDSNYIEEYKRKLSDLFSIDDRGAAITAKIDGKFRTIRLVEMIDPIKKSSIKLMVDNREIELVEGEYSGNASYVGKSFTEADVKKDNSKSRGQLTSIKFERVINADEVEVSVYCRKSLESGKINNYQIISLGKKVLKLGASQETFCGIEGVSLRDINLNKVAKVVLMPKVSGTTTQTNLSIKIGIEKRAIKLSPGKRKEMIKNLNESIKDFEEISKKLGRAVTTLKATCLATSAALIAKSFVTGLGGGALAREQAMSGPNGWIERCKRAVETKELVMSDGTKKEVNYGSMTQCLNANNDAINKEIETRKSIIDSTNKAIRNIEQQQGITTKGGIFTPDSVDSQKASQELLKKLKSEFPNDKRVKDLKEADEKGRTAYSYGELRDLYYNLQLEKAGINTQNNIVSIVQRIENNQRTLEAYQTSERAGGFLGRAGYVAESTNIARGVAEGRILEIKEGKIEGISISISGKVSESLDNKQAMIFRGQNRSGNVKDYLIVGTRTVDGTLSPENVYEYNEEKETDGKINKIKLTETNENANTLLNHNGISVLRDIGAGNKYFTPINSYNLKVRYFETEPFKGMPEVVPFDAAGGWYAKVEPKLGLAGTTPAYAKSGLPRAWKICNVGSDGIIGSDDDCQIVEEGISTNVAVLGQDEKTSQRLIRQSRQALLDAASQYDSSSTYINIGGAQIQKDSTPAAVVDAAECQQFMSVSDCKILFNVCDPVICPASRCDFGGQYRVADVIQSGIAGSVLLCLPNIREPIYIPICLTGLQAGIDAYISLLKNHRDCLQNSLDTGQMTGICDEIYSVYKCEFFWRQVAPIANMLIPKLIGMAYGERSARGGGEYLKVASAWNNVRKSVDYFTQTYAVNTFKAFQIRSIEQIGSEFCRGSISANLPKGIKSLAEPESPPQFHAFFDSIRYSDVTLPPTNQYKVFYHIYAGKTNGVSYQVYLKNPTAGSGYVYVSPTLSVASGFIAAGQYASETKDFSAPEGYNELCVRINGEDRCGFKQVTTDMGLNYLKDKYVKSAIEEKSISSDSECTSGSPSLGAIAGNINPMSAVESVLMPQDYKRGIIRICASKNPGASTDPTRYVEVGRCSDSNVKCWLDKESVGRAIGRENIGMINETLSSLEKYQFAYLEKEGYLLGGNADAELDKLAEEATSLDKNRLNNFLARISDLYTKLVLNSHKARLLLIEANAKRTVVYLMLKQNEITEEKANAAAAKEKGKTGEGAEKKTTAEEEAGTTPESKSVEENVRKSVNLITSRFKLNRPYTGSGIYEIIDNDGGKTGYQILDNEVVFIRGEKSYSVGWLIEKLPWRSFLTGSGEYYAFYFNPSEGVTLRDMPNDFVKFYLESNADVFFRKVSDEIVFQSKEGLPRECGDDFVNNYIGEVCDYNYPSYGATSEPFVKVELPIGFRLNRSDIDKKGLLYLENFTGGKWSIIDKLNLKRICTIINKNSDFSDKVLLRKPTRNVLDSCTINCKQYWEVLDCIDTDFIFNDGKKSYLINLFDSRTTFWGRNFDYEPKVEFNPNLANYQPKQNIDYKPYGF